MPRTACAASTTARRPSRHAISRAADVQTVRRDYRELVPLLRHRHDPDHPAAQAAADPDARRAPDDRCAASAARRGDPVQPTRRSRLAERRRRSSSIPTPATCLAVASYPFPVLTGDRNGDARGASTRCSIARDMGCIRRARRSSWSRRPRRCVAISASSRTTFTCARLPDGRVGATIPGWTRPVRDDVLDTHPHGTIGMHDGIVHSCNAYFAQLAVRVGPEAIAGDGADDWASPWRRRTRCSVFGQRFHRRATARATCWPRRCGWRAWRRRSPAAACFGTSGGRPLPRAGEGGRHAAARCRGPAGAIHARCGGQRHRPQPEHASRGGSRARPARRKSAARRRTPGLSALRRSARRQGESPSPSSSKTPATEGGRPRRSQARS